LKAMIRTKKGTYPYIPLERYYQIKNELAQWDPQLVQTLFKELQKKVNNMNHLHNKYLALFYEQSKDTREVE